MTRTTVLATAAICGLVFSLTGCEADNAQAQEKENTKIDLTVYRQDFGMVRDDRELEIESGRNRLTLPRLSQHLDPDSIRFEWKTDGEKPRLVSSTFNMETGSSEELLKRFIGQEVEFVWRSDNGRPGDRIKGTLEMIDSNGIVLRADGKLYVNPDGTLIIPGGGPPTGAGLSVELDSKQGGDKTLSLSYLTRGLSWSANYVAALADDADTMSLECWATVRNETGIDFEDASVTLVAGSPNRAANFPASKQRPASAMFEMSGSAGLQYNDSVSALQPAELGELHSYTVALPASVAHNQMNRVLMFEAKQVPIKRDYSVRLPWLSYGYGWGTPGSRLGAQLAISFKNQEDAELGMPLPTGAVRFYENDAKETSRYTGAAQINDTPKDAPVFLTLSKVFDVYVDQVTNTRQRIDKKTTRVTGSMVLHNEKSIPVELRLVQPIGRGWKMIDSSSEHRKLDSDTIEWKVKIPAGGERKLSYVVDLR